MAYNLHSLVHTLDHILDPDPQICISDPEKIQLQLLLKKTQTLMRIVDNFSLATVKSTESLLERIRDAAYSAQDIIGLAIADQTLLKPRCESHTESTRKHPGNKKRTQCFSLAFFKFQNPKSNPIPNITPKPMPIKTFLSDLQDKIDQFVTMIQEASNTVDQITESSRSISVTPESSSQNVVVGLDDDMLQLKGRLTGEKTKLEVIPIVGMGGIGKTTLAQKLYGDPFVISHFDHVAWATISQEYNIDAILSSLVSCITREDANEMDEERTDKLAQTLYQRLLGRRYLVVLDDVWATDVWDTILRFLPDSNNRSRIILTTRELDVANYANSSSLHHQMQLLNEVESWDLFHENLLGNIGPELEEIGRYIVSNCRGLPLAIQVICGLLSQSRKTKETWEHVANDVSEAALSTDERFPRIFSLSYDHLPSHLKPCLLYIGAFPEDTEIRVSKILRLWAAEGFLKPVQSKSEQEVGDEYINCLVKRNLILVQQRKSNGKVKSFGIHDLLRDLCLRKANEEKYVGFNVQGSSGSESRFQSFRRVSFNMASFEKHLIDNNHTEPVTILRETRKPDRPEIISNLLNTSRLLRVLDIVEVYSRHKFPEGILQLVNIRYLSVQCESLPSAISRLWNLETLIVKLGEKENDIPSELCKLQKLRHFILLKGTAWVKVDSVMEKLETLSCVYPRREQLFERTPNLKKLGMCMDHMYDVDLSRLHKLEVLKIASYKKHIWVPLSVKFPPSLKTVTLNNCRISNALMENIGSLPKLTVFKVQSCEYGENPSQQRRDAEWKTCEGGFLSLRSLELGISDLTKWKTEYSHFPKLGRLLIRDCFHLEEIPECIGDIATLESIMIRSSFSHFAFHKSHVASATKIQEYQRELGNDYLQLHFAIDGIHTKKK